MYRVWMILRRKNRPSKDVVGLNDNAKKKTTRHNKDFFKTEQSDGHLWVVCCSHPRKREWTFMKTLRIPKRRRQTNVDQGGISRGLRKEKEYRPREQLSIQRRSIREWIVVHTDVLQCGVSVVWLSLSTTTQ